MAQRVKVMVRLRPQNEQEKKSGSTESAIADGTVVTVSGDRERQHTFDRAFASDATQDEVFSSVGVDTINNVLKGYNGTVLAYGQTGSGKTHTMLGPLGGAPQVLDASSAQYEGRGVIPRLVEMLFSRLSELDHNEVSWTVGVSVFELYKELIFDSLVEHPHDPSEYRIREDIAGGKGVYVDKLFAKRCTTSSEVLEAIRVAATRRKVAATGSNETSSRSHSITLLTLSQTNHLMGDTLTTSRLTLVDLAGSEKVAKTQAGGERLKEAQSINLSLTLLGNVIFKLTDGKSSYIPYRDSKLTRLLQDSLGGNSCTTLLCCASPATYNKEETIGTLAFAARAKQITNKPRVNRDLSSGELKAALAKALDEIGDLKERLAMQTEVAQRRAGGATSPQRSSQHATLSSLTAASAGDDDTDEQPEGGADLQLIIERLMDEVKDLKDQLRQKEEALELSEKQAEFHRTRAAEADETIAELTAKLRREQALFERRLAELRSSAAVQPSQIDLVDVTTAGGAGLVAPRPQVVDDPQQAAMEMPTTTQPAPRRPVRGGSGQRRQVESMDARAAKVDSARNTPPLEPVSLEVAGGRVQTRRPSAGSSDVTQTRTGGSFRRPTRRPSGGAAPQLANAEDARSLGATGVPAMRAVLPIDPPRSDGGSPLPSSAELQLEIDRLSAALKKAKAEAAAATQREKSLAATLATVSDRVESLEATCDEQQAEMERLREQLAASEKRGADMKRILDALNIDIEEQLELERQRTAEASSEASRLRSRNDELLEVQSQQEFLDLATAELLFKGEDIEAIENDVVAIRFAHPDDARLEATRTSCLGTLEQLDTFVEHVLGKLADRRFATANLETLRLNVISDATELQARVALAYSRLRRD